MAKDENHIAGPSGLPKSSSDSNRNASSGRLPPSTKLRDKLNKLANRRIDISSIEFVNGAREFRGGYATVSQAFLVSPSSGQDNISHSNLNKKDGPDIPGSPVELEAPRQRKDVAVKKMHMSDDPERVLKLTLREAEFLAGLSHENVIKLEGFVEEFSKDVINDVAAGVEHLHSRQPPMRHGDLKSINILVNSECRAIITDFGSARHITAKDLDKETSQTKCQPQTTLSLETTICVSTNSNAISITLTGDQYTIRWAAPELLREGEGTLESDIWALGWVAYEVMTNSIPFQDVVRETVVIIRVVRGDLPSITENARMSLIQSLCSLMLACWSTDPQKRPTAEDCGKLINWMPMIRPNPMRTTDTAASRAPSPALLMQLGDMYRRQGDYVNASDSFTKALSIYRDVGDRKEKAAALVRLAQVHRLRNEYSQAVIFYSEALQIRTDIGDRQGRADALMGLALVHALRAEHTQAIMLYSEALQIRIDTGDKPGRASALWGLADVHRVRNEYSEAITFYSEALQIRIEFGDRQGKAYALSGLAQVHQARKEYSQAVTFYSEVLDIHTDIGDKRGRADTFRNLAAVHRLRSEYSQAITFYSEALQIYTDMGDKLGRANALWGLGEVHRLRNEYSQAIAFYSEALDIRTDIGERYGRAVALRSLGCVHLSQKEYSQAIRLFSEALGICTDIGDRSGRAQSLSYLGDVHRDQGNHRDAIHCYTQSAEVFEQIGDTEGAAHASNQATEAGRLSTRSATSWFLGAIRDAARWLLDSILKFMY